MNDLDKLKSTAEKLLAQRAETDKQAAIIVENEKEYAMALNGVCSTPNGELVFKTFIKALGVFTPKSSRDGIALVEDNANKTFYLKFIRPYLQPEIRQNIEG